MATTPERLPLCHARVAGLLAIVLAPLFILVVFAPPIPQDPAYHRLADTRAFLGIPYFMDVASSAAFLLVGALGLRLCRRGELPGARRAWTVFFAGVSLVAFGSGYYHAAPADATLVWDRLPMTVAFMALLAALSAEHLRPAAEAPLLGGALAVGVASVIWWRATGDLRLYAWVQFAPLAALVYLLAAFPARYARRGYLVLALALYAACKVFEASDHAVYAASAGLVSGHTVKHLLAALALYCIYRMLKGRAVAPA